MILIFAGFDHSGKSSLAMKLKEIPKYNFNYYRSTHQRDKITDLEEAIKHDWRFVLDILQQISVNLIFDRSFICQYIYSMKFRQKNIIKHFKTEEDYLKIFEIYCKILQKVDHRIIFCYRENYDLLNEIDEHVDLNEYREMNNRYTQFLTLFSKELNIINCRFEDGIENNLNKILENL